jgi:hypothetical protein
VRRTAREEARARVGREGERDRGLVSESIALIGQVQASFEASEARRSKVRQVHAVELAEGATILRWCAGAELLTGAARECRLGRRLRSWMPSSGKSSTRSFLRPLRQVGDVLHLCLCFECLVCTGSDVHERLTSFGRLGCR